MFGWLTKLLIGTPIQNSCSCCEGKRESLEKMRKQVESGTLEEENQQMPDDVILNCDTPEHEYSGKILGCMVSGSYQISINGHTESASVSAPRSSGGCGETCCKKCQG